MVSVCVWKRARSISCLYIAVRCWSSEVTFRRSNAQTWSRNLGMLFLKRQLQRQDLRTARPDFGTFERVIVEENEAIQSKVQLLRKRSYVLRLWPPINPPGHEVIPLQDHVRAFVEYLEHIELVVLTAQTEQETVAESPTMNCCNCLQTGGIAMPSIPSSPMTPFHNCIVAVQNDHLKRGTPKGMDLSSQDRSQGGIEKLGIGNVSELVSLQVIDIIDRIVAEIIRANQVEVRGSDPTRLRFVPRFCAHTLRISASPSATGEPGQKATISGVDDRTIADCTALIRSAAFCTRIDSRSLRLFAPS